MSYSLEIHPDVGDDVMEIFLSIDQYSPLQADRFVENVLKTYEQIIIELNNHVFLNDAKMVKYRSVGKFKRHLVYYTVNKKHESVGVLTVQYGGRDPDLISKIIENRLRGK